MTPENRTEEKDTAQQAQMQEQFIRQVDDRSRPAEEVLTDQQETHTAGDAARVFVP